MIRPYGTWESPLSVELVSGLPSYGVADLHLDGGRVRWSEARPEEGGRMVVVEWRDGAKRDVTPAGFNVRSRVHEYGGGASWFHGDTVFFSEFTTSVLYRQDGADAEPVAIVPEPPTENAHRYADGDTTQDGRLVVCVRERHEDGEVLNELVVLPADGSAEPRIVASGRDFYAAPRVSPDGRRLAWLSWDHPQMPWDGTELWVADLGEDGTLANERKVAGAADESVIDPRWSPHGVLHFCTDRNGWWNLHTEDGPLTRLTDGEIGFPAWVFAMTRYGFLADGRIACVVTRDAVDSLELLDPASGELKPAALDFTSYEHTTFAVDGGTVAFAAASPTEPLTVVLWDGGEPSPVHRTLDLELDPGDVSIPRAIEFPTTGGGTAHAFYYPPASARFEGLEDERPPLRVVCHGGPTAHTEPSFGPRFHFWTTRGIGVVDVNYRGSTGYGREYRRLLNSRWGEIDWQDCVAAARHLAQQGAADPARTWVEGGSAGGYVVFCALAFEPDSFAAGVSYFGVADAEALATETHKFEARYLDSMIGPYPERADLYRERSPIHVADRIERPMLILQGLDDKVVLPNQAEMMVAALDRKGIPHAYLAFPGEGHGFRKRENVFRSLEATLDFVSRVFGFEPADELNHLEIAHL